jgi:hypothetical protein
MTSRYMEGTGTNIIKTGISVDEKGEDPQGIYRPRVQNMDQSELQTPDEVNWGHCLSPHAPQIFGNNGKKFEDGEHGIGETPNWFLKGTMLASIKSSASMQETIILGAIPQIGKEKG